MHYINKICIKLCWLNGTRLAFDNTFNFYINNRIVMKFLTRTVLTTLPNSLTVWCETIKLCTCFKNKRDAAIVLAQVNINVILAKC